MITRVHLGAYAIVEAIIILKNIEQTGEVWTHISRFYLQNALSDCRKSMWKGGLTLCAFHSTFVPFSLQTL